MVHWTRITIKYNIALIITIPVTIVTTSTRIMPRPNPACLKAYGIPENKIIIDIEVVDFVSNP